MSIAGGKVRWGILGCANIAVNEIIPAILAASSAEVVAVASREIGKAKAVADRFGIAKAYGSYEQLLQDESIDAVYIPLPNHMHCEWTIKAAQHGKHVLCEKPFAMNAEQAQRMVDACREHGVKLAEAFMYRYHPRYAMIRDIIQSGEIGELRGVQVAFSFQIYEVGAANNIRMDGALGGGGLYDVGCYTVSGARLVTGLEPEAATVQALYASEDHAVDMMASGLMEFPNAVGLSFQCGMWAEFRNTLQIAGSHGRIDIPEAFVPTPGGANFRVLTKGELREVAVPAVNAYEQQMEQFSRQILEDRPLLFAPEDAVQTMKVLDACRLSAVSRQRIVIN
ncbi:putative dehydrogenase [Paenibacillus taihuensis]|uniref:Putative dehydrogenase n=1 Tax=Paenibacillus taihuensis TaxID=1156355 RepID=A0A3D9RXV4_9BACL|nr:Gfo/Idh/MocA family oxidoreductase [Paenibacillus taihuensis]REE82641.1 putative dehydrogenase [Paenibacillus taihuensis]